MLLTEKYYQITEFSDCSLNKMHIYWKRFDMAQLKGEYRFFVFKTKYLFEQENYKKLKQIS